MTTLSRLHADPGFVFKPTDQLIVRYLKEKIRGNPLPHNRILDRNLYNGDPWNVFPDNDPWLIVEDSRGGVLKKEIYVFTTLKKTNRRQIARVAGHGTWSGKNRPKPIKNYDDEVLGFMKPFKFKVNGNSKQDEISMKNGRWIMHEYTLPESSLEGVDNTDYAICRILWDRPKCCVNSEAAESLATELTGEASHRIEDATGNQALPDQELNSDTALIWVNDMPDEFSRRREESHSLWNLDNLHDQELNSEAALNWPPPMTDEEFSSSIEEAFTPRLI